MFCSKCGKEIFDTAVICPNCGSPTKNYVHQQTVQQSINVYSNDYLAIKKFSDQALVLRNLGICAAVLMFGIGIIFTIIINIRIKKTEIPVVTTTNPNELAEFEKAKQRLKLADRLSALPIVAIGLAVAIVGFTVAFS